MPAIQVKRTLPAKRAALMQADAKRDRQTEERKKDQKRKKKGSLMESVQNPAGFHTLSTGTAAVNLTNQNRTDHLLQKPDIFICYRHKFP